MKALNQMSQLLGAFHLGFRICRPANTERLPKELANEQLCQIKHRLIPVSEPLSPVSPTEANIGLFLKAQVSTSNPKAHCH